MGSTAAPAPMRWETLIVKHSARTGVPAALVAAVIEQESGGQPKVISSAGAVGLMQIVPRVHPEFYAVRLTEPDYNIGAGCDVLRQYKNYLHGEGAHWDGHNVMRDTVASYNGGPGNVKGIIPDQWPDETKRYTRNVLSLYEEYQPLFADNP